MKLEIHHRCSDFNSYRAARVKSLFNAESGCNFDLDADLPIDDDGWKIGLIVGPSGTGKSSMGRKLFGPACVYDPSGWPANRPIIDAIAPDGPFDPVAAALAAVGLGDVPAWLRPYRVLSNGERFRADLARVICDAPARVVIDEFTSVVDRQIARVGAMAFGKAWRRTSGKCVLLSCHYDIIDWLEPDWIFDTATGKYAGRGLWRRPRFELAIHQTDWRYWPLFEPHYYLRLPHMINAVNFVGAVDGEPVCHLAVGTMLAGRSVAARASRLVVMPQWQGAGVGLRFLAEICRQMLAGNNRWKRPLKTYFHTSHPGLCAALRRSDNWRQVSCRLYGGGREKSRQSIARSAVRMGKEVITAGYGGHFRAVQGFIYEGQA
jgi:GNAT superfamily N-acetyltransferase